MNHLVTYNLNSVGIRTKIIHDQLISQLESAITSGWKFGLAVQVVLSEVPYWATTVPELVRLEYFKDGLATVGERVEEWNWAEMERTFPLVFLSFGVNVWLGAC